MSKYKFSVIIPIYNVEDYLEETIESVINQTIGFKNNIQLVLINDGSPDNSEDICLKYKELYPDNIIYYKQKNAGVSAARNKGIELATGELTTFLDSDDLWDKNAFKETYKHYKKNPTISLFSCKMVFFDAKKGEHPLNYKYKDNKIINILDDYEYPQLSSSSIFIKTDILKKYRYDKTIKFSEDNKLINEIIFDEKKMMMLKNPTYYYRKRSNGSSAIQGQVMKLDWYLTTPKEVYEYLFNLSKEKFGRVIEYIQYLVTYEVNWRIEFEKKFEMSDKDRREYANIINRLLKSIDPKIILNHQQLNLVKKIYLLKEKGIKNPNKLLEFNGEYLQCGDSQINKKNLGIIIIDQFIIRDGKIKIYGKFERTLFKEKDLNLLVNGKKKNIDFYDLTIDYNMETYNKKNLYDYIGIKIELDLEDTWEISFNYKNERLVPRFKNMGLLTEYLPVSYHHVGRRTIYLKKDTIYVSKRNILKSLVYELKNELNMIKNRRFKALIARIYIKVFKLFKRRELWLISDRVNKADDNGEHFFNYMVKNHKDKNVYFVLSKQSEDYEKLRKVGKVIDPNTLRFKVKFGLADYVVSSQGENYVFNPLGAGGKYIRDQYNFKYIFLQHGIITNDLSPWLNINTKKMDMFVTSSEVEYESIIREKYYFDKDAVKLTGLARYDGLYEKKEKNIVKNQIMVSFTWRSYLASVIDKKTGQREYNEEFKNSNYFKMIDSLFNNKKLLDYLKKKNFIIKFCPHPNILPQLKDFQGNEQIIIERDNINYQKEFCENKILITDYSSVFFDFSYLRKPIIYYQPDSKEFFENQLYNRGYYDYDEDGFGKCCREEKELVEEIIKIIDNDCLIEEKYKERIEKFFKYNDNKNCERTYNEIINLK